MRGIELIKNNKLGVPGNKLLQLILKNENKAKVCAQAT